MAVLALREFRRIDLNSEDMGVPVRKLMANAGAALARSVLAVGRDKRIVVVCGKGNNGGDGYAAAKRMRDDGADVTVVAVEPPVGKESRHHHDALDRIASWDKFDKKEHFDVVVDCLLGSGIRGEPRPPYDDVVRWINERGNQGATVIACDVPSGMGSSLAVLPDKTVTFHAEKEGMAGHSGEIIVADIGIPWQAEDHVGLGDLAVGFPPAARDSHKGDNGRVLVIGGGPFQGAPYYSGMAAYRAGADLVHVASTDDAATAIRAWSPDLLVHGVDTEEYLGPGAMAGIEPLLERVDAVVLGPGLGTETASVELARQVLAACAERGLPIVVDADGLDGVGDEILAKHGGAMVLTPHGGEFKDLTGQEPDRDNVVAYAKERGVTVLRKGRIDVIASPERSKECRRGHPMLTVGGTGDVLAGAVAAMLARGATPFDAACAAAYMVAVAGEEVGEHMDGGATASDLLSHLPSVFARV